MVVAIALHYSIMLCRAVSRHNFIILKIDAYVDVDADVDADADADTHGC